MHCVRRSSAPCASPFAGNWSRTLRLLSLPPLLSVSLPTKRGVERVESGCVPDFTGCTHLSICSLSPPLSAPQALRGRGSVHAAPWICGEMQQERARSGTERKGVVSEPGSSKGMCVSEKLEPGRCADREDYQLAQLGVGSDPCADYISGLSRSLTPPSRDSPGAVVICLFAVPTRGRPPTSQTWSVLRSLAVGAIATD